MCSIDRRAPGATWCGERGVGGFLKFTEPRCFSCIIIASAMPSGRHRGKIPLTKKGVTEGRRDRNPLLENSSSFTRTKNRRPRRTAMCPSQRSSLTSDPEVGYVVTRNGRCALSDCWNVVQTWEAFYPSRVGRLLTKLLDHILYNVAMLLFSGRSCPLRPPPFYTTSATSDRL